jgi:hypothetical protein
MHATYALTALLVPFVGWYLLGPAAVLFGWTRHAFIRLCSWGMVLFALLTAIGDTESTAAERVAWTVAWLAAAAIGFRFGGRFAGRTLDRIGRRCIAMLSVGRLQRQRDSHELIVVCERRIGRPVDAAARLRFTTSSGARTHVLALAAGYMWWLESHPWRANVGAIVGYRPLDGLAPHTERRRERRHVIELSWPSRGELFVGTVYGDGADRLVGQLTADHFARTTAIGQVATTQGDSDDE